MSDLIPGQETDRKKLDTEVRRDGIYIPRTLVNVLAGVALLGVGFVAGMQTEKSRLLSGVSSPAITAAVSPSPETPPSIPSPPEQAVASVPPLAASAPPAAPDAGQDIVNMGTVVPKVTVSVPVEVPQESPSPDLDVALTLEREIPAEVPVSVPAPQGSLPRSGIDVASISDPIVQDVVRKAMNSAQNTPDTPTWAEREFGYIPQKQPGEEVPPMSGGQSAEGAAVEAWQYSDTEGGEDIPSPSVPAGPVKGSATIISPNSVSLNDTVIRISGIVSPGLSSTCSDAKGVPYDCLAWTVNALGKVLNGKDMTCVPDGLTPEGTISARCDVMVSETSATDVGSWMVQAGLALSDGPEGSGAYPAQEKEAREAGRGVWSGSFAFGDRSHQS